VYLALGAAPMLAVQKLSIFGQMLARGAPGTWERTAREDGPRAP
jgi:hypothetical protein